MKKIFCLLFSILSLISCTEKKVILGDRKDIFLIDNNIEILANKDDIKLSNTETFLNYYGDNSALNSYIENYKVDGFSLQENKISSKKFGVKKYFFSSPIIVDNILYTFDAKGNLIAKDINNLDKTLWKTSIINKNNYINYFGGKITYYNDVIYISDRINEIIAVSKDGEILSL